MTIATPHVASRRKGWQNRWFPRDLLIRQYRVAITNNVNNSTIQMFGRYKAYDDRNVERDNHSEHQVWTFGEESSDEIGRLGRLLDIFQDPHEHVQGSIDTGSLGCRGPSSRVGLLFRSGRVGLLFRSSRVWLVVRSGRVGLVVRGGRVGLVVRGGRVGLVVRGGRVGLDGIHAFCK